MSTLGKAIAIAAHAHQDQSGKGGEPLILHPIRIMLRMNTELEKVVAILHDVVENTAWTLEELQQEGFSAEVIQAVDLLTHRQENSYEEYIRKIRGHPLAVKVKLADLEDNLNAVFRWESGQEAVDKLAKYQRAREILQG